MNPGNITTTTNASKRCQRQAREGKRDFMGWRGGGGRQ